MFVNTGDRPVQIDSHLHLPDANAALAFDRTGAHGFRLDIPSGTSGSSSRARRASCPRWPSAEARRVPGLQLDRAARADLDRDGGSGGGLDAPAEGAG